MIRHGTWMIGSMAVNRDEFFAELDKLTDRQIEERLPYGTAKGLFWFRNTSTEGRESRWERRSR